MEKRVWVPYEPLSLVLISYSELYALVPYSIMDFLSLTLHSTINVR
jgi:hypothetical protein